ncbi:MAG TPA: alpha/beta hydrolase [Mycobacterium sp.]|nr:alpha/beta hydrolase [Mycobacterium sp.]
MIDYERLPVDPILRQLLEAIPMTDLAKEGVAAARTRLHDVLTAVPDPYPDVTTADHRFIAPAGHQIGLRVYRPPLCEATDTLAPLVLYCHGGGFALGDLDSNDVLCKHHAVGASAIVVSVDYRLAPEHPYPAAVDDVWAALRWVAEHASQIGADPARLAVAGDSAGGNLAAVLAQLARDAGGPDLLFQLLWYPGTAQDFTLPSVIENAEGPVLDLASLKTFTTWYAGHIDLANPPVTLAPARAETFAGLPPAFIGVAGHDPLRDDGIRYAAHLTAAGVAVQLNHAETLTHGYAYFAGMIPAVTETVDTGIRALHAALHP